MVKGQFSQKGFSLIETMVVVGILGASMLAVAGLFENTMKTQRLVEANSAIRDTIDEVKGIARISSQCSCNLPSVTIPDVVPNDHEVDLTEFEMHVDPATCNGGANSGIVKGDSIPNSVSTKVEKIQLTDFVGLGPNKYTVNLRVLFNRGKRTLSTEKIEKSFRLELNTTPVGVTQELTSCERIVEDGDGPGNGGPGSQGIAATNCMGAVASVRQANYSFMCPIDKVAVGVSGYFMGSGFGYDREYQYECCELIDVATGSKLTRTSCSQEYGFSRYSQPDTYGSAGSHFLAGEDSEYNGTDRKFKYTSCRMELNGQYAFHKDSFSPGIANVYGGTMKFSCPAGHAITGVDSDWSGGAKDRSHQYTCSTFELR